MIHQPAGIYTNCIKSNFINNKNNNLGTTLLKLNGNSYLYKFLLLEPTPKSRLLKTTQSFLLLLKLTSKAPLRNLPTKQKSPL